MAGATDGEAVPAGETANRDGESPVVEGGETTDEATVHDEGTELERTVGLGGGIAIGVGTMIGAGIFVFPGIAAGQAGPAAAGSFAIGAVVALLVALPASELATAMPRSGGGYYFISRGMGALFGAVVGLSLWFGLVFASAFYLVGFCHYATAVLAEAGIPTGGSLVTPLALVFGLLFTLLNVTGTENAAKLQNGVVAVLMAIIVAFPPQQRLNRPTDMFRRSSRALTYCSEPTTSRYSKMPLLPAPPFAAPLNPKLRMS
jgi:hypothetical protein